MNKIFNKTIKLKYIKLYLRFLKENNIYLSNSSSEVIFYKRDALPHVFYVKRDLINDYLSLIKKFYIKDIYDSLSYRLNEINVSKFITHYYINECKFNDINEVIEYAVDNFQLTHFLTLIDSYLSNEFNYDICLPSIELFISYLNKNNEYTRASKQNRYDKCIICK